MIFKKQSDTEPYVTLDNTDIEDRVDMDHEDVGSEESGVELIVDLMGEIEGSTDEEE